MNDLRLVERFEAIEGRLAALEAPPLRCVRVRCAVDGMPVQTFEMLARKTSDGILAALRTYGDALRSCSARPA